LPQFRHCARKVNAFARPRRRAAADITIAHAHARSGPRQSKFWIMTTAGELRSGKGHKDENFPVASRIIAPRHRALILAFYEFVRVADDIADHASLAPDDKLKRLDLLEANLLGRGDEEPEAVRLRTALAERAMSPTHPVDVLKAFRLDVTKLRYANWDELIYYCSYSAMPVGRFVLDVHGESRTTWPASDALCAALQVNNHLQDCAKDFRELNRVYITQDVFAARGAKVEELAATRSSPRLLAAIRDLVPGTARLLADGEALVSQVRDIRLAMEIRVIQIYAARILGLLKTRDPLCDLVHLKPWEMMAYGLMGMASGLYRHTTQPARPSLPAV
jgi:squalene synthase HpnC